MGDNGGFAPECQWMFLIPSFFLEFVLPASGIHPTFSPPSLKTSWFLDETLGVIAQLVERLHGMEEVWGSTPHGSTKCSLDLLKDPTPGSKLEYNSGQGSGEVEIAVKTALHIVDVHVSVSSFEIDVAG